MQSDQTAIETPADAHTRRERRKDARPGELLAAALDLFVEKGFAATRVEEVAKRAGVSKGTLFLYFSSKEDLFKAVVRENISGRFAEWNDEFERFEGSTAEMLGYCLTSWWERIGSTKASGIPKLMMSEAQNFPELGVFYQHEVVQPGSALIERILQRGIARGEFRPMNLKYGVFMVLAPLLFLALWKHSLGTCCDMLANLVPQDYIAAQLEVLLHVQVERAAFLPKLERHVAESVIVITLDLQFGIRREGVRPPTQEVAAAVFRVGARRDAEAVDVSIPLQCQRVVAERGIEAESALTLFHPVEVVRAIGRNLVVALLVFEIRAVVSSIAEFSAVAEAAETPLLVAATHRDQGALRIARIFRDDVDHAVDCVRSPQRGPGAANHFDAVHVLE